MQTVTRCARHAHVLAVLLLLLLLLVCVATVVPVASSGPPPTQQQQPSDGARRHNGAEEHSPASADAARGDAEQRHGGRGGEEDATLQAPSHHDIDNVRHNNRHSDRSDAVRSRGIVMTAAAASSKRDLVDDDAADDGGRASACERVVHDYLARLHDTTGSFAKTAHEAKEALAHARKGDAGVIQEAGHVVQSAVQALKHTEAEAKSLLGRGVPQVCIDEVQRYVSALPNITSTNELVRTWTQYYRILAAHVRTFYYVMRGITRYTVMSGARNPLLRAVQAINTTYVDKAKALYDELSADKGVRGALHKGSEKVAISPARLKKQALAALYTLAPYGAFAVAAVAAIVTAPLVLLYAVFGHGFYHTWLKLFVLFYHYGHASPLHALRSLGRVAQQAVSGDLAGATSTAANAFLGLASGSGKSFYSGYLMLFVLAMAAVATVMVAMLWWRGVRGVWRRMLAVMYAAQPADEGEQRRSDVRYSEAASQRPSRASTEKKRS